MTRPKVTRLADYQTGTGAWACRHQSSWQLRSSSHCFAEGPHLFQVCLKAHPLQGAFLAGSRAGPFLFHHDLLPGSRTSSRRKGLICCL